MSNKIIKDTYYSPEEGFVGVDKIYRRLKQRGLKVKKSDIINVLKRQEVYQKTEKINHKRNGFIARYPRQQFQIDLIYLENKHFNDNKYGLSVIDVFTRKGTVILINKKTSQTIIDALKKAFEELGKPKMIYADEGSEFMNTKVSKWLGENDIELMIIC